MRAAKNSHSTDGIVTSDTVRARKKMSVPHMGRHKRLMLVGVGVLVIAIGGYAAYKVFHYESPTIVDSGNGNTYTITDKQYGAALAKRLKSTAPAENAPTQDQISYYDDLMTAQLGAEDYKGVVANYKHLVVVTQDADLPVRPYVDAAKAYARLGDKAAALSVLDRAQVAVKNQTTDPDRLDAYNQAITLTRQEIQSGS